MNSKRLCFSYIKHDTNLFLEKKKSLLYNQIGAETSLPKRFSQRCLSSSSLDPSTRLLGWRCMRRSYWPTVAAEPSAHHMQCEELKATSATSLDLTQRSLGESRDALLLPSRLVTWVRTKFGAFHLHTSGAPQLLCMLLTFCPCCLCQSFMMSPRALIPDW